MNAPQTFPAQGETPPIVVRDRRFDRERPLPRWWCNGDPVATAWMNSLSASFPRGEALFIEAVKAFREGAPPKLEREIRAFIRQEVNHSREQRSTARRARRVTTPPGSTRASPPTPTRRTRARRSSSWR